jgi:hypothetical protein
MLVHIICPTCGALLGKRNLTYKHTCPAPPPPPPPPPPVEPPPPPPPVEPPPPPPPVEPPPPPPPPATSFNVRDYGAKGDGTTDDRAAIIAAVAAAGTAPVYFPAGTYYCASTLVIPARVRMQGPAVSALPYPVAGCQVPTAWIKGAVQYGSDSAFSDLRFGDFGKDGCRNQHGAARTTFTRCQFRGGGTASMRYPIRFGGDDRLASCDHITLTDCNVERGLGDGTTAGNNVGFMENCSSTGGSHMEYITFAGCHFGVSNGRTDIARNIGAPRGNVELYQKPTSGHTGARTGWHHIDFTKCVFEAADKFTLDIPGAEYAGKHTDGYCVVDTCTIYGGGADRSGSLADAIVIEGVNYVTVNNCDIYPAFDQLLTIQTFHGVDTNNWVITNNRFHADDFTHSGITARSNEQPIDLQGTGIFTGNTYHGNGGTNTLMVLGGGYWVANCVITGNEFHELRTSAATGPMVRISNATNCTITGNTFQTEHTSNPTFYYSGTNTGTTVINGTNNTLIHA